MARRTLFENTVAKALRECSRMDSNMDRMGVLLGGWLAYTKGAVHNGYPVAGDSNETYLLETTIGEIIETWHSEGHSDTDLNECGYYIAAELSKRSYETKGRKYICQPNLI